MRVLPSKDTDSEEQPQLTADPEGPHTEAPDETVHKGVDLVYSLTDRPPWYLCILLGFQVKHFHGLFYGADCRVDFSPPCTAQVLLIEF